MRIVFLDRKTVGSVPNLHILEQFGEVTCFDTTNPEQVAERIEGQEIVITNKVVLDESLISQAEALRLICVAATGTNNVDSSAAGKRGIPVKNVADYSSNSVAQGTFALIFHLLNNIPYFDHYVKSGVYSRNDIFTHVEMPFHELNEKIFGIIGLGNIGRKVAAIATAFGSEVVYYSTTGRNNQSDFTRLELNDLLRISDVVSIHAPLNVLTADLIDYEKLCRMKKTAILINVGRGGIVREGDLARALDEEVIAGAGVDVFEKEPIDSSNPLLHLVRQDRLVLTPHAIWASVEARTLLVEKIAANIKTFLSDQVEITGGVQ